MHVNNMMEEGYLRNAERTFITGSCFMVHRKDQGVGSGFRPCFYLSRAAMYKLYFR